MSNEVQLGAIAVDICISLRNLWAGRADWMRLSGGIERWHGGVHLLGGDTAWRWDRQTRRLVASAA